MDDAVSVLIHVVSPLNVAKQGLPPGKVPHGSSGHKFPSASRAVMPPFLVLESIPVVACASEKQHTPLDTTCHWVHCHTSSRL